MKINDVLINNWEAPGKEWWDKVEERPQEPIIEATISMTLSHDEYMELLERDKAERSLSPCE